MFTCSTRQNIASIEGYNLEIYTTYFYRDWTIANILYWYLHIDMRNIFIYFL
jgi:hypothetical protein